MLSEHSQSKRERNYLKPSIYKILSSQHFPTDQTPFEGSLQYFYNFTLSSSWTSHELVTPPIEPARNAQNSDSTAVRPNFHGSRTFLKFDRLFQPATLMQLSKQPIKIPVERKW